MKQLVPAIFLLMSASVSAQNVPTLISYEIDTMCNNTYDFALVHTIQVQDLDMDSTYLIIMSYDGADLNGLNVISPPYVPTATIRTFTITADPGTGLSPGLNLSDIGFDIVGNVANDGGAGFGIATDVAVYGALPATFDISSLSLCKNGNPIDLRAYASPAGVSSSFSWGAGDASYMFDPEKYYNDGGGSISYLYTNASGCTGFAISSGPIINNPPFASLSASISTCGNADGFINSYYSGAAPMTVYWSTGFSEVSSGGPGTDVTNLPAGNYYVNVTDANGCKAVALGQISDSEVALSYDPSDETCKMQSEDGGIDLSISSSLGAVNFIYWSNGSTSEDLTNVHMGEYTVEVHTDAGCEANASYTVGALSSFYAQNVNSTDANCNSADGVIDYDIYSGSGAYSYLWSNGATTQDLFGVTSGSYECLVTDVTTGCQLTYWHDVFSYGGPGASINFITKPTCNENNGSIDIDVYPWGAPIVSISWSSGQTTEDIYNLAEDNYELTVIDQNGCTFGHTIRLKNLAPEKPEICMLTVDTSLIYNMIVWEKDPSQTEIAAFNIYRETSTYGEFELVASRAYALESFYQDNDASPVDRSWRYYLTAVDNCGNESEGSYVHKTIHVVSSTSGGVDYDVHWDNYEGLNYSSVDISRHDDVNGWVNLANLPFGTNMYTDTPPVVAGLDYLVTFILTDPCTSTKVQDHNSSRSNKSASVFMPGGSTAQVEDVDLGIISIYPNPASEFFVIHIDQVETVQKYEILDLNGNLVNSGAIISNNTNIATDEMAAGIYMVRIYTTDKVITQKLVLN